MVLYCDYIKICTQDQDAAFSLEIGLFLYNTT